GVSGLIGLRLIDGVIQVPTILPQLQPGFVDRDLDEPGAEARLPSEAWERRKCLQDRFLGYLLSVRDVVENGHRGRKDASLARLDQSVKGFFVSSADPLNQLSFVVES